MNELLNKQRELDEEIQEIEIKVSKLLNFGNVPVDNWEEATRLLNIRMQIAKALDEIRDVIRIVDINAT